MPKPGSVANNDACREPPVSAAPCERGRGKRKREPFAAPGKRDEQARAEPARKKRVPPKSKSPSGRKPSTSKSPSGRKSSTSKSHSSKDASVPFLNETNHATEPFFCADEITAVETVAELMSPPRRPRSTRVTATALRAGTTPAARVDSVDPVDPVEPVTQPEANPRADAFPCAKSPVDRLMETETSRQHVSPAKTKAATRAPAPFAKGSPRELNGNLGPPVGLRLLRQAPGGSSTPPAPPGSPRPTHEVGASRNRDARGDGSVLANLLLSSRGVGKQAGESQTKESRTTKPTIQCIAPPSTRVSGAMKFVTFAPTPPQKKQHTEPGTAETPLGSDFPRQPSSFVAGCGETGGGVADEGVADDETHHSVHRAAFHARLRRDEVRHLRAHASPEETTHGTGNGGNAAGFRFPAGAKRRSGSGRAAGRCRSPGGAQPRFAGGQRRGPVGAGGYSVSGSFLFRRWCLGWDFVCVNDERNGMRNDWLGV